MKGDDVLVIIKVSLIDLTRLSHVAVDLELINRYFNRKSITVPHKDYHRNFSHDKTRPTRISILCVTNKWTDSLNFVQLKSWLMCNTPL